MASTSDRCQGARFVQINEPDGKPGSMRMQQCKKDATCRFTSGQRVYRFCTVHMGSFVEYGKAWLMIDDQPHEITLLLPFVVPAEGLRIRD